MQNCKQNVQKIWWMTKHRARQTLLLKWSRGPGNTWWWLTVSVMSCEMLLKSNKHNSWPWIRNDIDNCMLNRQLHIMFIHVLLFICCSVHLYALRPLTRSTIAWCTCCQHLQMLHEYTNTNTQTCERFPQTQWRP